MSRKHIRISRGLIGILSVTIALGIIFYFHDTSRTKAADQSKTADQSKAAVTVQSPAPPASKVPVVATPPQEAPLVSSAPKEDTSSNPAPTVAGTSPTPSTKPALVASADAPVRTGPPLSKNPLGDGKSKMESGDLLGARQTLNTALVAGKLSPADAQQAKAILSEINQAVVFSPKRFAYDEYGGTYTVQPGELLQKIAAKYDITWQYLARANGLADPKRLRANATIKVLQGPFHALVEKKKFNMEIWVGGEPYAASAMFVTSFPVGLGKDDSTPDGKWMIQTGNKIKNPTYYSPRGEGVIEAGDPKNPLGEYWLGLVGVDGHAVGKMSYGIHGTIDPNSIGKQESLGCIRMRNEDVAQVFELLVEGKSTVTVRD